MQTKDRMANLIFKKSSGTRSEKQTDSTRSGNDTQAGDGVISKATSEIGNIIAVDSHDNDNIIKSQMELHIQNKEHERMILESVENDLLIWPAIEENGVTRTKKYVELYVAEKIQADCDIMATNIILHGLPADIYSLVNHHKVAKDL
nr:hypothetical protein [Tanacetum cinerariifolium]